MYFLFFIFYFSCVAFSYLTKQNWNSINKIIINKEKYSQEELKIINNIIYSNYKNWAFYKSYQIKQFHFYKCKQITQTELNLYASTGLQKAIANYNPNKNTTFSNYAIKYIIGEVYNGMTILQPLNLLSIQKRKITFNKRISTNQKVELINEDEYLFDTKILQNYHLNSYANYYEIWEIISFLNISETTTKILPLKYDFDFSTIRSNKQISILLNCSEENIRQHLHKFKTLYKLHLL